MNAKNNFTEDSVLHRTTDRKPDGASNMKNKLELKE